LQYQEHDDCKDGRGEYAHSPDPRNVAAVDFPVIDIIIPALPVSYVEQQGGKDDVENQRADSGRDDEDESLRIHDYSQSDVFINMSEKKCSPFSGACQRRRLRRL
jgi:hypothetical protein